MPYNDDTYECYATVIAKSEKAVLFEIEGEQVWVPHSQLREVEVEDLEIDEDYDIVMTQWIAETKGLV